MVVVKAVALGSSVACSSVWKVSVNLAGCSVVRRRLGCLGRKGSKLVVVRVLAARVSSSDVLV